MPLRLPPEVYSRYGGCTRTVMSEWPGVSTTWRVDDPAIGQAVFLKVVRSGHFPTVFAEAARLQWAIGFVPVPAVLETGTDGESDWLVTGALGGIDATRHPRFAQPERLVPALARGLARFHAATPVAECPFDFTAGPAIDHARSRVREGIANPADLHPEHRHLTLDAAVEELERLAPADEDLVGCHGDYCLPNVLLDDHGTVCGYIDLGELGVADRACDVVVGAWSVTWNLGAGLEELFYRSYGYRPDARRVAFYRLLYDLVS